MEARTCGRVPDARAALGERRKVGVLPAESTEARVQCVVRGEGTKPLPDGEDALWMR